VKQYRYDICNYQSYSGGFGFPIFPTAQITSIKIGGVNALITDLKEQLHGLFEAGVHPTIINDFKEKVNKQKRAVVLRVSINPEVGCK